MPLNDFPQLSPEAMEFLEQLERQTGEPTAQDAVREIIKAEGDLDLAGERLFGPKPLHPDRNYLPARARLVMLVAEDPQAVADLQKHLRTLTLLQAYQSARLVGISVDGSIQNQKPEDLVRLYNVLLTNVATLTDDHTQTQNLNAQLSVGDALMANLPPEIKEALRVVMMEPVNQPSLQSPIPNDEGTYGFDTAPDYNDADTNPDLVTFTPDPEETTVYHSPADPPPNAANGTT